MKEIFLSASIPQAGRGNFFETADPFLIQFAVRELVTVCLGRRRIIWGGHPSITPMVHAVCQEFGVEFHAPVKLYVSNYFEKLFPQEHKYFDTTVIPNVDNDRDASLTRLRREMLSRPLAGAVFIGGMEGIFEEFELFHQMHGGKAPAIALRAPGGAAGQLAEKLGDGDRIDFARLFHQRLEIAVDEAREFVPPDQQTKTFRSE